MRKDRDRIGQFGRAQADFGSIRVVQFRCWVVRAERIETVTVRDGRIAKCTGGSCREGMSLRRRSNRGSSNGRRTDGSFVRLVPPSESGEIIVARMERATASSTNY